MVTTSVLPFPKWSDYDSFYVLFTTQLEKGAIREKKRDGS